MRKSLPGLMAIIFVLCSPPASAQENIFDKCVGESPVAMKGYSYNQFSGFNKRNKALAITSWLTGYQSGLSHKDTVCALRIGECIDNTSVEQRIVMVEKEANKEPHKWGAAHNLPRYFYQSFVLLCLNGEIPLK